MKAGGILFARRPAIFENDRDRFGRKRLFTKYEWWPTLDGEEPLSPILLACLIAFGTFVFGGGGWLVWKIATFLWHINLLFIVFSVLVLRSFAIYFWPDIEESEPYKLTTEYVKAKKARFCPEVVFEGRKKYL